MQTLMLQCGVETKSPVRKSRKQKIADWYALQKELTDYNLYKDKIKNNCFICGLWYRNNWELYQVFGNCCPVCSGRIVSVLYCNKQRTKTPLTREEASKLLAARRSWILDNHLDLPPSKRKNKNYRERTEKLISG
jgi:hypothetical protein